MPKAKRQPTLFNPKPSRQIQVHKTAQPSAHKSADTNGKPPAEKPKPTDDEEDPKYAIPEGPYTEYNIISSAASGWNYDIFKFHSQKHVDVLSWPQPIKLNRKDLQRSNGEETFAAPEAVGPMLGPDGKPVIGVDGRIVMVDATGRPIHPGSGASTPSSSRAGRGDGKGGGAGGRRKFQKKTRQVFLIPEETRKLRKEERYPWVMEDASGNEVWHGQLDDITRSETHGMFIPTTNSIFQFVPIHRWYKLHKKPKFKVLNLEEAEAEMQRLQKSKGLGAHRRRQGIKGEDDAGPSSGSLVITSGRSLGPGGRRLKTVDKGSDNLFGDDDEDGTDRKRRDRELGADGDLDEMEYEEDFADDDEKIEEHGDDDEEIKEMEERLKREYKAANKTTETGYDESDEDEDSHQLSGAGKALRKLMRTHEKDDNYESDDDKNPYASSEEEEEEEEVVPEKPAIDPSLAPKSSSSRSQTPAIAMSRPSAPSQPSGTVSLTGSRANSPVPNHGGHSLLAKRATSPKPPKILGNRATSPSPLGLGTPQPRQSSPGRVPRTTSPHQSPTSPSTSVATPLPNNPNKRKATDDGTAAGLTPGANGAPKPKKRKGPPPGEPLDYNTVLDWLRANLGVSTRHCIAQFSPYLFNEEKKREFTGFIKKVASLNGGVLTLKTSYKNGRALTPTPAT